MEEEVGELRQVLSLLALLVQKYALYITNIQPSAERGGGGGGGAATGTQQVACFTGTQVHILTQLRWREEEDAERE